jgi:hypothetical protein
MKRVLEFAFLTVLACFATSAAAQVQTKTTEQTGQPTTTTQVQRAEVVYVNGNDLVLRMEDGQIKHISVPEGVTATVDGKELSVHDLKPGMKLERTITTTSTPKTVTTVKTVEGTVFHVTPPTSVILRMDNGENKEFKIPKGQKFMVNGQETDAFGLKQGMKVSATAITEVPETEITQEVKRTGQMPPPPETPPSTAVLLIMVPESAPSETAATQSTAPAETAAATDSSQAALPQTATFLPLLGLLGVLCVGSAFLLKRLAS